MPLAEHPSKTNLVDYIVHSILEGAPSFFGRHPSKTYRVIRRILSLEVTHPRDLFRTDTKRLRVVAKRVVNRQKNWAAAFGLWAGLPGGALGIGAMTVDFAQYIRRVFIMTQEIGQVYGVIPNPFWDVGDATLEEYYLTEFEQILSYAMLGFGVKSSSLKIVSSFFGDADSGANIAEKQVQDKESISILLAHRGAEKVEQKKAVGLAKEKMTRELVTKLVEKLGEKTTGETIDKIVKFAVPVVGGILGAASNYVDVNIVGDRLMDVMEAEHKRIRQNVIWHWRWERSPFRLFYRLLTKNNAG